MHAKPKCIDPFALYHVRRQQNKPSAKGSNEAAIAKVRLACVHNPVLVEDDDKIGEANAVTSVESEDGIAKLHNSFSKEFTIDPTTETTIKLDDRLRPNSTTLPTPGSLSAFTSSPLVQTAQGPRDSAQDDKEQWEITAIIGKRRIRKGSRGYEYEVRWKNTWLRRDDLRNAQELLRNFESGRPQEMAKWCGPTSL